MTIFSSTPESPELITRRAAVLRVTALLGGVALVGGTSLLSGCGNESSGASGDAAFSQSEIAFLDEVAETILPETKTPGAKAAKVGAFMALMVTDSYSPSDRKIFRDGMRALDGASEKANGASFMSATPAQRLALLQVLDQEQKTHSDAREAARRADAQRRRETTAPAVPDSVKPAQPNQGDAAATDQRKENAVVSDAGSAAAITKDTPAHYFRMMKELALLGYFTSEIGCTKALRYVESPGRFDKCAPYVAGEPAQAGHA